MFFPRLFVALLAMVCSIHGLAVDIGTQWTRIQRQDMPELEDRSQNDLGAYGGTVWSLGEYEERSALWNSQNGLDWSLVKPGFAGIFSVMQNQLMIEDTNSGGVRSTGFSNNGVDWTLFPFEPISMLYVGTGFTSHNGKMWRVGGHSLTQDGVSASNVWSLAPGGSWTLENGAAEFPARTDAGLIRFKDQFYFFGGWSRDAESVLRFYNDVWRSTDGVHWSLVTEAAPWAERARPGTLVRDETLWIFGGAGYGDGPEKYLSDMWVTADGETWTQVPSNEPRLRRGSVLFYSIADKFWITGAKGNTFGGRDLWSSEDGTNWELGPSVTPLYYRSMMPAVAHRGAIYVLGGEGPEGMLRDVWHSEDGNSWEAATTQAPWAARRGHNVVVHDGALWLMGGSDGTQRFNDVWRSADGAQWTLVNEAAPWSPRYFAAATSHGGKLWIMGGHDGIVGKNDVWSSNDGVTWDLETEHAAWMPKSGLSCVSHRGKLWAIAGRAFDEAQHRAYNTSEIWVSDNGHDWALAPVATPFTVRENAGVVSYGGRIYVSGGYAYFNETETDAIYLNDVWSTVDGKEWRQERGSVDESEGEPGTTIWLPRQGHGFVAHDYKLWIIAGQRGEYSAEYGEDIWYSTGDVISSSIDLDLSGAIDLDELLRAIQFYNSLALHCEEGTEDGYAPGPGLTTCPAMNADYAPQDWSISIDELLRLIQFYNTPLGYTPCEGSEDGFCPVP